MNKRFPCAELSFQPRISVTDVVMGKITGLRSATGRQQALIWSWDLLGGALAMSSAGSNGRCGCQGVQVVAEVDMPAAVDLTRTFQRCQLQRLLVLEGIQDPGNVVRSGSLRQSVALPVWPGSALQEHFLQAMMTKIVAGYTDADSLGAGLASRLLARGLL